MKPLLLLLAFCIFASAAAAQGQVILPSYSIGSGAAWVFRYQLDHGSSAQAIQIDASINCQSSPGVTVRILDIDDKYNAGAHDEAGGSHAGSGVCNVSLLTDVRSGVHPFLVIVQTFQPGDSVFNGHIDIDAGGITPNGLMQSMRVHDGLFIPFGHYAAFNEDFTTQANFTTNVTVDYGSTAQAMTLRFEGIGSGVNEVRLYDVTAGDVLVKTLYAPMTGNMTTWEWVTTASHSGEVQFRIEVEGNGSAGSIFWAMWLPETVSATGGSGDGVPVPPKNQKNHNSGGGCVAGAEGKLAALALLGVLAMLASLRVLRSRRGDACVARD
jgi:hypothetical protein